MVEGAILYPILTRDLRLSPRSPRFQHTYVFQKRQEWEAGLNRAVAVMDMYQLSLIISLGLYRLYMGLVQYL